VSGSSWTNETGEMTSRWTSSQNTERSVPSEWASSSRMSSSDRILETSSHTAEFVNVPTSTSTHINFNSATIVIIIYLGTMLFHRQQCNISWWLLWRDNAVSCYKESVQFPATNVTSLSAMDFVYFSSG